MNSLYLQAIKSFFQRRWRSKRMNDFINIIQPKKGCKILDIGGLPELWEFIEFDANITLFNLPNTFKGKELNKYQ